MPRLCTKRLLLRPLTADDVPGLHRLYNDPAVGRYLWDAQRVPLARVVEVVAQSEACFRDLGAGLFAIELLVEPGTLAGFCGFRRFPDSDHPELLYGILPEHWGRGYVTEAARAVLCHGFERCALQRIVAATDTPNTRSVKVLQRLGMSFRERREYHGLDTVFYDLAREDFSG